jgi:hypothetical protein
MTDPEILIDDVLDDYLDTEDMFEARDQIIEALAAADMMIVPKSVVEALRGLLARTTSYQDAAGQEAVRSARAALATLGDAA